MCREAKILCLVRKTHVCERWSLLPDFLDQQTNKTHIGTHVLVPHTAHTTSRGSVQILAPAWRSISCLPQDKLHHTYIWRRAWGDQKRRGEQTAHGQGRLSEWQGHANKHHQARNEREEQRRKSLQAVGCSQWKIQTQHHPPAYGQMLANRNGPHQEHDEA